MSVPRILRRPQLRPLLGGCAAVITALGFAAAGPVSHATAAVPDKFAFVLYDGVSVIPYGTTPSATTVSAVGLGVYKIVFPGAAAKLGVAHVTAVNAAPHWCEVNGFGISGSDEVLQVSCYKVGGGADNSGLSAIWSSSSGTASSLGAFGYVDSLASGALVTQYNSAGAPNTVTHAGTGVWRATFNGLASPAPIAGSWQVTAVNNPTVPARCKILSWSSSSTGQTATINCYGVSNNPFDTEFTLTYQYQRALYGGAIPPKYYGYLWNQPVGGPTPTNYNSAGGTNVLSPGTAAVVQFPNIGVPPNDIQVSASGQSSDFCLLDQPWTNPGTTTLVKDVTCYTVAGAPSASGFLISDSSAL